MKERNIKPETFVIIFHAKSDIFGYHLLCIVIRLCVNNNIVDLT